MEEQPRLWQLLHTYVLAETREGLIIIDQHSAHERILFERLTKAFEVGGQTGQRLLFPITVRLSKAELLEAEALTGVLNGVGFEVGSFGGDTLIVHAVPDPHPYFDAERCIHEMMEELVRGSDLTRSAKNQHERIAMTFACKGSIKAGQKLNEREMQELFDQLFATNSLTTTSTVDLRSSASARANWRESSVGEGFPRCHRSHDLGEDQALDGGGRASRRRDRLYGFPTDLSRHGHRHGQAAERIS